MLSPPSSTVIQPRSTSGPRLTHAPDASMPIGFSVATSAARDAPTDFAASTMPSVQLLPDEPLFRSVEAALRFAYGHRQPLFDIASFLASMLPPGLRGRRIGIGTLTPQERVAQAAMILGFISRLDPPQRAAIEARHLRGRDREIAQWVLARSVRVAIVTHNRLVYEIVARHYGKRVHLGGLAERFSVHRNTVFSRRAAIEEQLCRIDFAADDRVGTWLVDGGIVERS